MTKLEALAKHLDCDVSEIDKDTLSDNTTFTNGREEYLVLTESEADDSAQERILDSIWAFKPSFLECHMEDVTEDMIKSIQEACEDATPVLLKLLDDKNHFVNDAILSDGRGHFISSYDGEEHEVGPYYIYRTN